MADNEKNTEVVFRPPARVLVIDDSQLNRSFIANTFLPPNYEIHSALDGAQGLEMAGSLKPELILLDIMMPNMDGFEVCSRLKKDPLLHDIPVIFITALDAIQDKLKAFDAGGVDFVTKPFNHKELLARVRTHVTLHRVSQQKAQMLRIAMEEKRHETIARIAAGITHNFNNMLGVSFGNIMLVESLLDKTLDSTCREALADVRKSLERMQQMVRRFLILTDRSKLNDFIPVSLDLCALLDEVNADLKSQNEQTKQFPNVGIDSRVEPGTKIFCSENHAREMFHMIFTEAIETSLGRVRIRATTDSTGGEDLLINLELEHFSIPESIRDSIFEPFAMPLANVGTGLAFAVARQLAEKNGGTISAIFDSPGSTRFVIRMKKG